MTAKPGCSTHVLCELRGTSVALSQSSVLISNRQYKAQDGYLHEWRPLQLCRARSAQPSWSLPCRGAVVASRSSIWTTSLGPDRWDRAHQSWYIRSVDSHLAGRLLCPRDYPSKHTGVACHFLLQGIFLTQGLSPHLLHCRQILFQWATWDAELSIYWGRKLSCFLVNGKIKLNTIQFSLI